LGFFAGVFLTVGGGAGAFYFRIHEQNGAVQSLPLPRHLPPGPASAILVVAPHCDDETLGTAGLLAEAVRAGARVRVVLMTNGDGYRMATARRYRQLRPDAATYIRFAYDRQRETLAALGALGVRPDQVTFLGYPDGGLAAMWSSYWGPERLFTSRYTRCSTSPYRNAYRPDAPYCGQSVLRDLEAVLREFQPTDVYLPHPGDDHPDHWSAHCYAMAALERLRAEAPQGDRAAPRLIGIASDRTDWVLRARVYCYLVHRGDWPVPQGEHVQSRLVPPAPLLHLDTQWETLTLSPEALAAKQRALGAYRSQMAVMGRFLRSFLRRDELFGILSPREVGTQPAGVPARLEGEGLSPGVPTRREAEGFPASGWGERGAAEAVYIEDWDRFLPVIADSAKDTLLRDINGSGDVTAIYAVVGPERLHLRLVTRKPLSPRLTYRVRLRPVAGINPELSCAPIALAFKKFRCSRPGVSYAYRRNSLEISIPLADLGYPRALFLGADTDAPGVTIDRIAWRILRIDQPEVERSNVE
jgi:LmbE family N-acetylglucosaminyl deacetylase